MIKSGDFINRARIIYQNKFPLYSFLLPYKKKNTTKKFFIREFQTLPEFDVIFTPRVPRLS